MQIRPSSDLRNNYASILKLCRETKEPIFLTVNGRGDSVIMPIEDYDRLFRELQLERLLAPTDAEIAAGETIPATDVYAKIEKRLGK